MDSSTLSSIKEKFENYMDGLSAIYTKDKTSAQGQNLSEDEPLTINSAETNGRDFANLVFTSSSIISPAEAVVLSDAYDQTQALTRLSQEYSKTRQDYYNEAVSYNETQQQRVSSKKDYVLTALESMNSGS